MTAVYARPGIIAEQERGEPCGCEWGATYTTEGLSLSMKRCNVHQSAPALLEALEAQFRTNPKNADYLDPTERERLGRNAIEQVRGEP